MQYLEMDRQRPDNQIVAFLVFPIGAQPQLELGVGAIANFLSASANGQTNGRRSSALNCHRCRLSLSLLLSRPGPKPNLEPKMMKSTKRQRQRQRRRLNCKMLSSCWFLFFIFPPLSFLFWSLATLRFQPDSNAVVSSSSLSLSLSPRLHSTPAADRRSSIRTKQPTRTSSNQICFMTTATTQNAQTQAYPRIHSRVLCVCVVCFTHTHDARSQA